MMFSPSLIKKFRQAQVEAGPSQAWLGGREGTLAHLPSSDLVFTYKQTRWDWFKGLFIWPFGPKPPQTITMYTRSLVLVSGGDPKENE